jgi:hypothetical protein
MDEKHTFEPEMLDPDAHEGDSVTSVWKRRMILVLLIILVVAVAAPTFGGCSGFFASRKVAATYEVAGTTYDVSEDDLARTHNHLNSMMLLLGMQRGLPEGEAGVNEALRKLMLASAAKASGVRVPDAQITELLESRPQFQVAGKFDEGRYRTALSNFSRGGLTHEFLCDALRLELLAETYEQLGAVMFEVVPGDGAYDAWKKRSVKLSVEFVTSPYEAQRARIEAMQPTIEELDKIAALPAVKSILAVPPRKTVEVAYLKVEDMTDEQFAAAKKFADEAEIFSEDRPLDAEAFVLFHNDRESNFTKAHWGEIHDPGYPARKKAFDADYAAWEKEPKEGRRQEPAEPKDPTIGYPTEEPLQYQLWKDRAQKEVLAQRITNHLAVRAEKDVKSLADVGAEYARFGVKVVKNPEPLADDEIVAKFPDPVARDSEFEQVVRVIFKAPAEGAVFKPQYQTQAVPTTMLSERIHDRGYMVLRLDSCDPARQYQVGERREAVLEYWRKYQIAEAAKTLAEEIRKKAEAASPDVAKVVEVMEKAASEAGLTAQSIRRFNRTTDAPKAPVAAAGQTLSPENQAAARRIAERNRVQQDYQALSSLDAGKLRDPVLVDDKTSAAYVIAITEKHEPLPVEMREADLNQEEYAAAQKARMKFDTLFGYEALAKQFNLRRFDEKPSKVDKPADPAPTKRK